MPRRLISASCAAVILLLGVPTVHAAPPDPEPDAQPSEKDDASERVDQAIEAWRKGEWTEVRDLLEPLVREGDGIEDDLLRESALRYLAEATLLDEGLESSERRELAQGYVTRLLDTSQDWTPPSGLHGRAFYDLVAQVRSDRDAEARETCRGELLACEADKIELEHEYETLEERYRSQQVQVTEITKRNRGLALLPLGIGHFTNDNFALGGTFLALEVATGAAGLGLLIYRARGLGCTRTNGFAPKSLVCTFDGKDEEERPRLEDHVETVRNAEIVMGYLFLSSIILDVVLAQVLFKSETVVDKGMKPREELETDAEDRRRRRIRRQQPNAKLKLRPHPAYFPGGVGLGVTLRF
ncbi:MAG: hypothetical protein R6X02_00520 [Enhygromyxa sp.]